MFTTLERAFFGICLGLIGFVSSVHADALVLKSVALGDNPVKYNSSDKAKPGICQEIIQGVEAGDPTLRFDITTRDATLPRVESMLEHGEADVFFCLVKSAEREKKFNYVDIPLYSVQHVAVVKADDAVDVKGFEDIRKLGDKGIVMVSFGSALKKILQAEQLKIDDSGKGEVENLAKLVAGRGRFVYGQDFSILAAIKEAKLEGKVKVLPVVFKEEGQYLVTSKSLKSQAVEKVKAQLEKMRHAGDLKKISAKYK